MTDGMIRKAGVFEIVNHWAMSITFLILGATGFGFLFHMETLNMIFGDFNRMRTVHNWCGVAFSVLVLFKIVLYLPHVLSFDGDDVRWLLEGGGYLSKNAAVPPQGKLNAGQKLFAAVVIVAGVAMAASGYIIWLMPGVKEWLLLSQLVHNVSFDLLVFAIPIHIYLASLASPGSARVMLSGTVPLAWARKRHAKWVAALESKAAIE